MKCFLNDNGAETATFDFDNGYTLSIVKRWGESFCNTAAAYYRTDGTVPSEFKSIGSELSDDEVAAAFAMVSRIGISSMSAEEKKTALEIAERFEVYANDIDACINRGYYKGAELTKQRHRRDEQRSLAAELRTDCARPK